MKRSEGYDYSGHQEESVGIGDNSMSRLVGLAREQLSREELVEEMEGRLREAQDGLREVSDRQLPALMEELDIQGEVSVGGLKIKVQEAIRGSIPKANQDECFQYLRDDDNGALIKRQVVIEFGMDEEAAYEDLREAIHALESSKGRRYNVAVKRAVHPATLQSYVKRQLEAGVDFPMDLFGVLRQTRSRVKASE